MCFYFYEQFPQIPRIEELAAAGFQHEQVFVKIFVNYFLMLFKNAQKILGLVW